MRMIKNLFIMCFFLVFASGCETYKDYEMEFSPVYPLSGEWLVRFTDPSVSPSTSGLWVLSTFNTADNATDKMWIRATAAKNTANATNNQATPGRFVGKINCDVAGLTFNGTDVVNSFSTATTSMTFTITEGKIIIDGYDTATGGKTDKISFTMTDSRKPGVTYTVEGYRRTRWYDDEQ